MNDQSLEAIGALLELEAAASEYRRATQCKAVFKEARELVEASEALAAIRAKEEQEQLYYLPEWSQYGRLHEGRYSVVLPVAEIADLLDGPVRDADRFHVYRDGRFTGEVITGQELVELLEGKKL